MSSLYKELSEGVRRGIVGGRPVGTNYGREAANYVNRYADEQRKQGNIVTGYKALPWSIQSGRGSRSGVLNVPIFGRDPAAAEADLRKEQARLAGIQQATFEKQQADIASQLRILQGEKSSIAKMRDEYSQMLIKEAERRKQAEEDARIALQSQRANRMMEGQSANLQIQPAGTTPRTGGTQQFRRRALQQGTTSPYTGLSKIKSGTVNV